MVYTATFFMLEVANDTKFKGSNYETLGKLLWGRKGRQIIILILFTISIATFIGGILFTGFINS